MSKEKKNSTPSRGLEVVGQAVRPGLVAQHELVDRISSSLSSLGFSQIILPPFHEGNLINAHGAYRTHFGEGTVPAVLQHMPGMIFPPTQVFNAHQLYLNLLKETGNSVLKWFYISPVIFEKEGRMVIHHEVGIFIMGSKSSLASAQIVNSALRLCKHLGVEDVTTMLNTVGCQNCRNEYLEILESQLEPLTSKLCRVCNEKIRGRNSLAVFACDKDSCRVILSEVPQLIDCLDDGCREDLVGFLETMDELEIPYTFDSQYPDSFLTDQIVFQLHHANEGNAELIGQGGGYSHIASSWNEDSAFPALGFLTSLETLSKFVNLEESGPVYRAEVFVISLGDLAARRAMNLYDEMRISGIRVREAMLGSSGIQNQLRAAKSYRSMIALIVGQKEAMDETVILRDLRSGMQEVFTRDRILEEVKKRLGR